MRFIGNKINLLNNIQKFIDNHVPEADTFCDLFSGTTSVASQAKTKGLQVYSNDLMYFSYCLQKGLIENSCKPLFKNWKNAFKCEYSPIEYFNDLPQNLMEKLPLEKRFIQNNYSPDGDRMYLTRFNSLRIDYIRNTIEDWKNTQLIDEYEYFYLLACVIASVPLFSNISGTYGAFNKFWDKRALRNFEIKPLPVIESNRNNKAFNEDGINLLTKISGDILYLDPPYNSRQYLPNYHLLETIARYDFPELHGYTGQRINDAHSDFCSKQKATHALEKVLENAQFKHIIMSYSTEGIMSVEEIESIMKKYGKPDTFDVLYIPYRRFKSQSLTDIDTNNDNQLNELLFYIEK